MFKTITSEMKRDTDYPARQFRLSVFKCVLDGELYDHLQHGFYEEKNGAGEYIPLRKRRPCVKYNLSKIVVDDSVGLLFSEGHFPDVESDDDAVRDILPALIKETQLNAVMMDAAIRGSVGSVAILFRVLDNRVFFTVMDTQFLTPSWNPIAPDTLSAVVDRYKVKGCDLIAVGIPADKDETYWYQRDWTDKQEIHYQPQKLSDASDGLAPAVDETRTVQHNLGFVPVVWVKNLPGGDDIDGACTFKEAIDTQIEIDYLLSQGGRGLKYSSDPTLLIKEPAGGDEGSMVRGAANAVVVSEGGDAKLLEISGTAAQAVIDYVKFLRECALETVHGNRSNAEKISVAQSGRAMEMMNAALIMLADRLRISYAEGALLSLLKMVVKSSHKFVLRIDGKQVEPMKEDAKVSLRWPAWYPPTSQDQLTQSQAIDTHVKAGVMSPETGTRIISADFDIEDVEDEREKVAAEQARVAALQPAPPQNKPDVVK